MINKLSRVAWRKKGKENSCEARKTSADIASPARCPILLPLLARATQAIIKYKYYVNLSCGGAEVQYRNRVELQYDFTLFTLWEF